MSEGSAPLGPLTLVGPGFLGLNTQLSSTTLGPEWATVASNCVFDDANRLAARQGWASITVTPATGTPNFDQLFQYTDLSAVDTIISAGSNKLFKGTSAFTDITGAVAITADNWKFVNFNGLCYGLQTSHALVQYNGAGNFTNVAAASGTVPDGNELLGAFGHLWGTTANGQTLKYSALLDATNWTTGAGSFNFTSVWPTADRIVALAAFNNLLVVFGSNNIIILSDNTGSSLGMNPTNTTVIDVIPGVGCISRDTVQNVNGEDLCFLSYAGVRSLRRVIQEKSNPLRDLSCNVRSYLLGLINLETVGRLHSAYVPFYGLYLLMLPVGQKIFAFDTKFEIPDTGQIATETSVGAWRVTIWDNFVPQSFLTLKDGKTLYAGQAGKVYQYGTQYLDDAATYTFNYTSGWLNIGEEVKDRIKLLKRVAAITNSGANTTFTLSWAFDFSDTFSSAQFTSSNSGLGMEWGVGEWGVDEWGGSSNLTYTELPTTGSGQFIKLGAQVTINAVGFALQQLQLFAKIGRIR